MISPIYSQYIHQRDFDLTKKDSSLNNYSVYSRHSSFEEKFSVRM